MPRGLFLAFVHPRSPDDEEEVNRWYTEHHLPEILRIDGVTSASRYRSLDPDPEYGYLASYTLEGPDLAEIVQSIFDDGPNRTPTDATRKEPPTHFSLFEFLETQTP